MKQKKKCTFNVVTIFLLYIINKRCYFLDLIPQTFKTLKGLFLLWILTMNLVWLTCLCFVVRKIKI